VSGHDVGDGGLIAWGSGETEGAVEDVFDAGFERGVDCGAVAL